MNMDDELAMREELSKLSEEELHAIVRAFVEEDLAERLRKGEIVIVGTAPDGAPLYQKTAELSSRN